VIERDDDLVERREFLGAAAIAVVGLGGLSIDGLHAVVTRLEGIGGPIPDRDGGSAARPFNMIVLGDSITWGQGLPENQKFSALVRDWVQEQLPAAAGVSVRLQVFAHSGAVIDGDDGRAPKPGELPASAPSITKQIELAKTWLGQVGATSEQVDLVLMDGGMNDVGPSNILNNNPNFTTAQSAAWVADQTKNLAVGRMATLLTNVATTFQAATIVVTGYYPIVSKDTQPDPMYSWVSVMPMLLPLFLGFKVKFDADWLLGLHDRWTQNCRVFDTTVRDGQQQAVADLNRQLGTGRIVHVTVPFAPENSYGTSPGSTWLWTFGDQAFATGVAERRRIDCAADGRTGFDLAPCQEAEAGHPNLVGARKYADAIIAALGPFVPQWLTEFAPPPPPDNRLIVRIDPTPHIELDKPDMVTVYATDRVTRAPVNGTVLLGRRGHVGYERHATNKRFEYTFCRRTPGRLRPPTPATIECDVRITVTAPGYQDAQFVLAIPQATLDEMSVP
jgi:lysophospholipase L1-like esterase